MWLTFESSGRWAPKLFCPSWPPCWWPHAPLPWLKQCPAAPTGSCRVRMWGAKTGCCRAQKEQRGAKTGEPDSNLDNASAQDLSMETSVKRGWIFLWHRWRCKADDMTWISLKITERLRFLKVMILWKAHWLYSFLSQIILWPEFCQTQFSQFQN